MTRSHKHSPEDSGDDSLEQPIADSHERAYRKPRNRQFIARPDSWELFTPDYYLEDVWIELLDDDDDDGYSPPVR